MTGKGAVKLHFHTLLHAENWFNHLGKSVGNISRVITMFILCETRISPLRIYPRKMIQEKLQTQKFSL